MLWLRRNEMPDECSQRQSDHTAHFIANYEFGKSQRGLP